MNAWKELNAINPDIKMAITNINDINGLGTPSFASKHLRMLRPQVCPVLDSIIRDGLGIYPFNPKGYEQFSKDCLEIASSLQKGGIDNQKAKGAGMKFAADVEMAILEYLRSQK